MADLRGAKVAVRDVPAWALRKQYREPVQRQALSVRCRAQAHLRIRNQSGEHRMFWPSNS